VYFVCDLIINILVQIYEYAHTDYMHGEAKYTLHNKSYSFPALTYMYITQGG